MSGLFHCPLIITLLVWLWGGIFATAGAQVGASYTSLESLVAGADSVVLGTILKVSRDGKIPSPEELGGERLANTWARYELTVQIDDVLKGDKRNEVTLKFVASPYYRFDNRYEQWRDAKTQCLWFFGARLSGQCTQAGKGWQMIRLGEPVQDERHFKIHAPPIFSMDFKVLKERDEIIATARRAVKILDRSNRKPIESIEVNIPRGVAQKCRPSGDVNSFTVPLVEELEAIAQKMVSSPETLDKDFSHPEFQPEMLQAAGIKILAYFR